MHVHWNFLDCVQRCFLIFPFFHHSCSCSSLLHHLTPWLFPIIWLFTRLIWWSRVKLLDSCAASNNIGYLPIEISKESLFLCTAESRRFNRLTNLLGNFRRSFRLGCLLTLRFLHELRRLLSTFTSTFGMIPIRHIIELRVGFISFLNNCTLTLRQETTLSAATMSWKTKKIFAIAQFHRL